MLNRYCTSQSHSQRQYPKIPYLTPYPKINHQNKKPFIRRPFFSSTTSSLAKNFDLYF